MDAKDLDYDELAMISQYIQNQQEVINELTQKNMQLTTEIQLLRVNIKQHEKLNNEKINLKVRESAFKQARKGFLNDALSAKKK